MSSNHHENSGNIKKQISHDYNIICDVCGRKKKRSECVAAYGSGIVPVVMSCIDGCADKLQPLNFPPPVIFDGRPVPDARPDQLNNQETFLPYFVPSFMSWGHFPGGLWGNFNNGNSQFSYNPEWVWGQFNNFN